MITILGKRSDVITHIFSLFYKAEVFITCFLTTPEYDFMYFQIYKYHLTFFYELFIKIRHEKTLVCRASISKVCFSYLCISLSKQTKSKARQPSEVFCLAQTLLPAFALLFEVNEYSNENRIFRRVAILK